MLCFPPSSSSLAPPVGISTSQRYQHTLPFVLYSSVPCVPPCYGRPLSRDTPQAFILDSTDAAAHTTCVPGNSLNCVLLVGRSECSFMGRGGKRIQLPEAREHYSER